MSTKVSAFKKFVRELIRQELKDIEEASVTGNLDGGEGPPRTPYAFYGGRKKDKEKKKRIAQAGGYMKVKESVNERLNQSQAKTLLRQLGGNKFIMMTGAKQMSIGKNGLTMKIGRNSKSITHVAIDLDRGKDLYIMKFIRVRKGIPKVVKQYDGIYADNLNNIFEKETGLYTRL